MFFGNYHIPFDFILVQTICQGNQGKRLKIDFLFSRSKIVEMFYVIFIHYYYAKH